MSQTLIDSVESTISELSSKTISGEDMEVYNTLIRLRIQLKTAERCRENNENIARIKSALANSGLQLILGADIEELEITLIQSSGDKISAHVTEGFDSGQVKL